MQHLWGEIITNWWQDRKINCHAMKRIVLRYKIGCYFLSLEKILNRRKNGSIYYINHIYSFWWGLLMTMQTASGIDWPYLEVKVYQFQTVFKVASRPKSRVYNLMLYWTIRKFSTYIQLYYSWLICSDFVLICQLSQQHANELTFKIDSPLLVGQMQAQLEVNSICQTYSQEKIVYAYQKQGNKGKLNFLLNYSMLLETGNRKGY